MSAESRRLGRYELQVCLASGGMGEVWKALDTHLPRYVAIKLLLADKRQDPDFVNRFEREAHLLPAVTATIMRCLAKDSAIRFPSATAMTTKLAKAFNIPVQTQGSSTGPVSLTRTGTRPPRQRTQ